MRRGQFPEIMSMGPYPKEIPFKDWSPADYPRQETNGESMHWETPLPETSGLKRSALFRTVANSNELSR